MMSFDFKGIASRTLPKMNQLFDQARQELTSLLEEESGTTLSEFIKKGNIEHAIFMQWVAIRDIIYRRAIPTAEASFLRAYLASRGLRSFERKTAVSLTVGELAEYTRLAREWAWSLRQSVTPRRGKILEKVVRLAAFECLKENLSARIASKAEVAVMDTSHDKAYNKIDATVIVSLEHRRAILGLSIKGNVRERKDEAVDTRRRALHAKSHQAVWHVFLSDGDRADLDAMRQMQPTEDGTVYTWRGLAEKIGKDGIKPISELPDDIVDFATSELRPE